MPLQNHELLSNKLSAAIMESTDIPDILNKIKRLISEMRESSRISTPLHTAYFILFEETEFRLFRGWMRKSGFSAMDEYNMRTKDGTYLLETFLMSIHTIFPYGMTLNPFIELLIEANIEKNKLQEALSVPSKVNGFSALFTAFDYFEVQARRGTHLQNLLIHYQFTPREKLNLLCISESEGGNELHSAIEFYALLLDKNKDASRIQFLCNLLIELAPQLPAGTLYKILQTKNKQGQTVFVAALHQFIGSNSNLFGLFLDLIKSLNPDELFQLLSERSAITNKNALEEAQSIHKEHPAYLTLCILASNNMTPTSHELIDLLLPYQAMVFKGIKELVTDSDTRDTYLKSCLSQHQSSFGLYFMNNEKIQRECADEIEHSMGWYGTILKHCIFLADTIQGRDAYLEGVRCSNSDSNDEFLTEICELADNISPYNLLDTKLNVSKESRVSTLVQAGRQLTQRFTAKNTPSTDTELSGFIVRLFNNTPRLLNQNKLWAAPLPENTSPETYSGPTISK